MPGKHNARPANYFCQASYYFYTHDKSGNVVSNITEEQWKQLWRDYFNNLIKTGEYRWIVYIFHHSDKDNKGNPKGLHVHWIINFKKGIEQSSAMNLFNITRAENCQPVGDKVGAFRYLIHITEKALQEKKYIYNFTEIEWIAEDMTKCNFEWLMKQFYPTKNNKSKNDKEVLDDVYLKILKGEFTLDEAKKVIVELLGSAKWASEKKKADSMVIDWMWSVNKWYTTHNACKITMFVSGGGGAQKTDLVQNVIAPHFADKRGVHVPPAPMGRITYDPIGTFRGEKVSILNEITGDSWILEGFCETLDPTHSSTAGSRFADKPFFPDYVCMTTSDCLENFILKMFLKWLDNRTKGHWEIKGTGMNQRIQNMVDTRQYIPYSTDTADVWNKVWQVRRRIPIVLNLHDGIASIDLLDYSKEFYYIDNDGTNYGYLHFADVPYSTTDETVKNNFLRVLDSAIAKYFEINNFTITPQTVQRPVIDL